MTDQNFQVPPLPPKAPAFVSEGNTPSTTEAAKPVSEGQPTQPAAVAQETVEIPANNLATRFKLPVGIYKTKIMSAILGGTAVVGILLGALMFGGSSQPVACPRGLGGVIQNPDIQTNLGRCGTVRDDEACVVYIVNHSRNDKRAGEFVAETVKLTGRQDYMIQIVNKQYVNTLIPPGYIAQIQVPRLR